MKNRSDTSSVKIHPARMIAGSILTVIIAAFTLYLSVIMLYRIFTVTLKGSYIVMFAIELVLCSFMLLLSFDIRFGLLSQFRSKPAKVIGIALRVLAASVTALILFLAGKVIIGGTIHSDGEARYTVVLGLALRDGKPTEGLLMRLDTAEEYLNAHPDTTLILTGGNPGEDGRTEADVMHDLLAEKGVPEERMKIEDKAATTIENFRNTAKMIGTDEPIALVTSNYHMDRAAGIADKAGFKTVLRIPAGSDILPYGADVMWEIVSDIIAFFSGG